MAESLGDSLDSALEGAFTRRIPQSAQGQMKYLVKQLKGTKAAALALGVPQRTVERYVKGRLKRPRRDLADRTQREVKRRRQPQIRAKAKKKAASTDGLVVHARARFGSPPRRARPTTPGSATSPRPCRPPSPTASSPPATPAPPSSSSSRSRPKASRRCTSVPTTPARTAWAWSSPTSRRPASSCSSGTRKERLATRQCSCQTTRRSWVPRAEWTYGQCDRPKY